MLLLQFAEGIATTVRVMVAQSGPTDGDLSRHKLGTGSTNESASANSGLGRVQDSGH